MPESVRHMPVMVGEVLRHLACAPGRNYIDLTAGGGGHAAAILEATAPSGFLVAIDRDEAAVERTRSRLQRFGKRVSFVHGPFDEIEGVMASCAFRVDGALIDCGVSSDQLEDAERGFSFRLDGPLDMRMDTSTGVTARQWLWERSEAEIADTLFTLSDERRSRAIARAIVAARRSGGLRTTLDLSQAVLSAVPRSSRSRSLHPATRTFQALRMAVNDELGQLDRALKDLVSRLPFGARLVTLTFHSAEDRVVKHAFRDAVRDGTARALIRSPQEPDRTEIEMNPRARSAKLRAVEVIRGRV